MIIVHGSVQVQDGKLDEALALSRAHVARSRLEDGCLSHAVSIDADNPRVLVFFEEWRDRDALLAHFRVPESLGFVRAVSALATARPNMRVFEAAPVQLP